MTISTQVIVANGRPDIEIRAPGHLVYVEVKVEAEVEEDQLRRYRCALDESGYVHSTLVLLTRYPAMELPPCCPDVAVRWYDVADWLEEVLANERHAHTLSAYIVGQFLDFLYGRNLGMKKVGPELGRGVEALGHLLAMIKEAMYGDKRIRASNLYLTPDFVGYYIGASACYVGLHYEQPAVLEFSTYNVKISKESLKTLTVGQVWDERGVGLRWKNRLDLEAENAEFFSLSKADQMRRIEDFSRASLDIVEDITDRG